MMENAIDYNLTTHSREQAMRTCPRKHYWAYESRLRPKHTADPLRKGGAFHKGIEQIQHGMTPKSGGNYVRQLYADMTPPPWMEGDEFVVEAETVAAMVHGWGRRWEGDMILEPVAVEVPFRLPIINPATGRATPTFESAGKIDGIAKLPDGRLCIVERKTVGESIEDGSDYWQQLRIDNQLSRYYLAAKNLGYDIQTAVYDVVRKSGIAPKLIKGVRETPTQFGARLLADMAERPAFYFARVEIPRLESDLRDYQADAWIMQRSIREAQLDQKEFGISAWPRNTSACRNMGKCPYFSICLNGTTEITEGNVPDGFRIAKVLHEELLEGSVK